MNSFSVNLFVNELEQIGLHTDITIVFIVKCFKLLLSNINNFIQY